MFIKKSYIGVILLILLNGCAGNTSLLGSAYSLAQGKVSQAGLTFGSDKAVNKITGKTTSENFIQIFTPKKKDSKTEKSVKKKTKKKIF